MKVKKNKKRKVWPFVLGIIGTLCIMAALAVTLCRTRAYVIEGNNYYSDNTIRTWIENDKLSFNTLAILAKYNMTEAELPAGVEQLHISLKNPWTVKVTVEEKEMAGYVTLDDADTASLRKVPGIGRYYASRIVRYRNDLGGYVSVAQLSEIEGIPEAALSYFRVTGGAVRKLNLNRLTLNELKHHPYINFYQARRIIDYRRLKGPLHSIDDLRLLKDFSQRDIDRLRPYVEF